MTAQLTDAGDFYRPRICVLKTVKSVRAALPEDLRAQFNQEMETGTMPATFERWWMRANEANAPTVQAAYARIAAGTWRSTPAEQVFGSSWTGKAN